MQAVLGFRFKLSRPRGFQSKHKSGHKSGVSLSNQFLTFRPRSKMHTKMQGEIRRHPIGGNLCASMHFMVIQSRPITGHRGGCSPVGHHPWHQDDWWMRRQAKPTEGVEVAGEGSNRLDVDGDAWSYPDKEREKGECQVRPRSTAIPQRAPKWIDPVMQEQNSLDIHSWLVGRPHRQGETPTLTTMSTVKTDSQDGRNSMSRLHVENPHDQLVPSWRLPQNHSRPRPPSKKETMTSC